jgi:intracellular multiplication protein IcmP
MPPAAPQSQEDRSLTPMWIIAGIGVAIVLIWVLFHAQIAAFIYKLKLLEIQLINIFPNNLGPTEALLRRLGPADYYNATYQNLINISALVGNYLRYPIAILLFTFALILIFGDNTARFRNTYNMERLILEEKENWPQITPIAKLGLNKVHVDEGPWAMAMAPMQFAKKYKLLQEEQELPDGVTSRRPKTVVSLIRGEAHRIFSLQLGDYWTSLNALNDHTKALFAVFAAHINRDREGPDKFLAQIARSTATAKLDFSGTDALLAKHVSNKEISRIVNQHAYIYTIMISMLKTAREGGVLASADFLWLKPLDRVLWFVLNCVGRQTPCSEVAGIHAHWLAEMEFGYRIKTPMVDEAVNALELGIKEIIYVPDDE